MGTLPKQKEFNKTKDMTYIIKLSDRKLLITVINILKTQMGKVNNMYIT